jgi:biotin carboxyl carrier protein
LSKEKNLRSLPDGRLHNILVERLDSGYRVSASDPGAPEAARLDATVARSGANGPWSVVTAAGGSFEVTVERRDFEIHVEVESRRFAFASGDKSVGAASATRISGRVEVKAPMPGKVVKLFIGPGERVSQGQPVVLFEAMKMQNELRSPQDGILVSIDVESGQAVESRERLYIVEPS